MPEYQYTAQTSSGKRISGSMTANDEEALSEALKQQGNYLIKAKQTVSLHKSQKLNMLQISEFCRELGTLLSAGVSLVRALKIISQQETIKPVERKVYDELLSSIRQGDALSEAMNKQGAVFPQLLINMIKTGEAGGNLDKVTMNMATHYEKSYRLSKKVSGAMTYPAILLIMIIAVTIFIVAYIMPQFETIFSAMPELPGTTKFLLAMSNAIKNDWAIILIVIVLIVIGLIALLKVPAVRLFVDKMKVKYPYFGKLMKIIYSARFARTINSLYSAGLLLVSSLSIGVKTVGNKYVESQFNDLIISVRSGQSLSSAIRKVDGFVHKLADSIMVGEETGSIDTMLNATADSLEYDSDSAVSKMITFLEPALIILMAAVIGFIMISVMTPIYQYYQTMQYTTYI